MPTGCPTIDAPLAALEQCCHTAVAYNDPRTTGHGGKATGKPESRSPGFQQSPSVVRDITNILEAALLKANRAIADARIREMGSGDVQSYGGVAVGQAPTMPAPKPYKRRVSVDVTTSRLVAKYAESE